MKYICVGLAVCLSIMVFTRGRPAVEPYRDIDECSTLGFCAVRLPDGYCRWFNSTCDYEKINCQLQDTPWRLWDIADDNSECMFVKRPNQVSICKSSCPVTKCRSVEPACGANSLRGHCFIYENLCELKRQSCRNTAIYHADMQKCAKAGLRSPGDSGRC